MKLLPQPPPFFLLGPISGIPTFLMKAYTAFPRKWVGYDEDKLSMAVLWTTQFPTDLNNEADIKLHRDRMAQGGTGLALGGGTVLRYVEFSPGYEVSFDIKEARSFTTPPHPNLSKRGHESRTCRSHGELDSDTSKWMPAKKRSQCMMHRTQSVDYGIVTNGEVIAKL